MVEVDGALELVPVLKPVARAAPEQIISHPHEAPIALANCQCLRELTHAERSVRLHMV